MCSWGLEEWGYFANIVLAAMSVFTAIVTAIVLAKQLRLQKQSIMIQNNGIQPIFRIYYDYKNKNNGKENDSVEIRVMNEGHQTKYSPTIAIHSFIEIFYQELNRPKESAYLKIENFYRYTKRGNASNEAIKHGHFDNNLKYYRNLKEGINNIDSYIYKIERFDLIRIEYKDINNSSYTLYYKNGGPIDQETYYSIISSTDTKKQYKINELKPIDIQRYINSL